MLELKIISAKKGDYMKKILHNPDFLKTEEITKKIDRAKVLLINSNNELLLGFEHNTYQFIGGHVEDGETLMKCISREVREETGIELSSVNLEPFFMIKYFCKDYPSKEENSEFTINYYVIINDDEVNLENVEYTENEIDGNFELKYIPLENIEKVLNESIHLNKKNKTIVAEMLEVLKEYKNK